MYRRFSPSFRAYKRCEQVLKTPHAAYQRHHASSSDLDRYRDGRERIVILGSGWAGYNLSRSLDKKKFQVVVISPRSYFVFTPLLASTSVGTLEFRCALEPVRTKATKHRAHYLQGWADSVDFDAKTITVEESVADPRQGLAPLASKHDGENEGQINADLEVKRSKGELFDIAYDKLVIAVGCYSQTFNTPGVREHANFLKDVGDARKIRKRLLECFETAALPTTPEDAKRELLHFAVVGGGPTGIEFSAELHDILREDLAKIYPTLAPYTRVTVYDVAPQVLNAFDRRLAEYAMETFRREGIAIKTSTTIKSIEPGLPLKQPTGRRPGFTLHIPDHPPIGAGMVVWSTGIMQNPFIAQVLSVGRTFPDKQVIYKSSIDQARKNTWTIARDDRSGGLLTNDRLRVILRATDDGSGTSQGGEAASTQAFAHSVFGLGDCAVVQGTQWPATAQVASQKAEWLAKRLNKGDLQTKRFVFKNAGVMAYIGNWRAILQGGGKMGNVSGRAAWLIWRGVYLVKAVSWRNRILIPIYWFINWAFGRDITRF